MPNEACSNCLEEIKEVTALPDFFLIGHCPHSELKVVCVNNPSMFNGIEPLTARPSMLWRLPQDLINATLGKAWTVAVIIG